jgi:hypothetical protein
MSDINNDTINDLYRDPDRGFKVWHRDELPESTVVSDNGTRVPIEEEPRTTTGKHVPNVKDLVIDFYLGWLIVIEVDHSTGYSVLMPWNPAKEIEVPDDEDPLIALHPGPPRESFRIFLDTSVTPFTLSVDSSFTLPGSMVDSYRIFLGTDINPDTGKCISQFIDGGGNFLGTAVPLESVSVPGATTSTIKVPLTGYTTERMDDGETVSLAAYSDDGSLVYRTTLVVINTALSRSNDVARRYIKGIQLESPFLSSADPQTIEFPLNVAVESLPMYATVHYHNGDRIRYPIDDTKFFLFGRKEYIATTVGQKFPMTLAYVLSDDEVSYMEVPTANRRITKSYQALTTTVDGSYEVKLYVYPQWVNPTVGYRLVYWLYNLDRQTYYDVTSLIEIGTNSPPFEPLLYGTTQRITVAIDLNRVDNIFAPYRHVQTFQLALLGRGDMAGDIWQVFFTSEQSQGFGRGLSATVEYLNTNDWKLYLSNGYPGIGPWMRAMFEAIEPLYDQRREVEAPKPTHFLLRFKNNTYEFPIESWGDDLIVNNDLNEGELLYIHWINKGYSEDLQLGVTALPIRQITAV